MIKLILYQLLTISCQDVHLQGLQTMCTDKYVYKQCLQVVDNLDNLEEVVPMLKQLGGRHGEQGYNVPSKFFPVSICSLCIVMFTT